MDNGLQFILKNFEDFCEMWNIRLSKYTLRYPQGNCHAETANKLVLYNLKKRFDSHKNGWYDELQGVIWTCQITP